MQICMIGSGYVGLVSGACFAEFGWNVTCVDKDEAKVALLQGGGVPIYEPGLDKMIAANIAAGRIVFTTETAQAVAKSDVVFLAVGTPMRPSDGQADLTHVYAAVAEIAPHLRGFTVVCTKSTVPVGTSRVIERILREARPDAEFAVCSNPEFLREGSALPDFMKPDRILVGCDDDRARAVMGKLYSPLTDAGSPLLFVSRESAELAKYAANAFLALKISFVNEIADLCEHTGANVQEVSDAIGRDKRIGDRFLNPGPGYGGSCFPKDVSALVRIGRKARSPLTLIEQVQRVNDERKLEMVSRIERLAGGALDGKTIAVLGVTFKPDTDDMREAPSLVIVPALLHRGAEVRVYDPQGARHGKELLPTEVVWAKSTLEAAIDADIVVVLTEWDEFRALDLGGLAAAMNGRMLVDLRNVFDETSANAAGLEYHSIGRSPLIPQQMKQKVIFPSRLRAESKSSSPQTVNGIA